MTGDDMGVWKRAREKWLEVHSPAVTFFINDRRSYAQNQMRVVALNYLSTKPAGAKLPPLAAIHSIHNRTIDLKIQANHEGFTVNVHI